MTGAQSKAGFTRGPWFVVGSWVSADEYGETIVAGPNGDTADQAAANAHLISAAPELYASLIELLEPLERASAELVAHGKTADQNAEAAFDRAHFALAKARGEQ